MRLFLEVPSTECYGINIWVALLHFNKECKFEIYFKEYIHDMRCTVDKWRHTRVAMRDTMEILKVVATRMCCVYTKAIIFTYVVKQQMPSISSMQKKWHPFQLDIWLILTWFSIHKTAITWSYSFFWTYYDYNV